MTAISSLLQQGRTFSFELMPPRTPERERQLAAALEALEPLQPSFVSITYGAGGSTRERTHGLVKQLLQRGLLNPMAHLTCAAHSRAELTQILTQYASDGLKNVLALRGDPPLNDASNLQEGELKTAVALVELAREVADFCVAVAMHPEGHPHSKDRVTDRHHQAVKLAAADFGITQFFFNADHYFDLVETLSALGVDKPVLPGIMPPANVGQSHRMAEMSGTVIPQDVERRLAAATDADEVRLIGVDIATELAQELLDRGAPGIHLYTMNKAESTLQIYDNLGLKNTPTP